MRIYVASSWRNEFYTSVLHQLRSHGHEVHDWREDGFSWRAIDEHWSAWTPSQYLAGLKTETAERGFARDMLGVHWCEACVYLMPCGVSASLEAGYIKGKGKPVVAYVPALREPDLMVKIFDLVTDEWPRVLEFLEAKEREVLDYA